MFASVIRDWPLYWFASLDCALKRGDRRRAQEARRKLERLGFDIRFTFPVEDLAEKHEQEGTARE